MTLWTHMMVTVVAGAVFCFLTGPPEVQSERRWKTHLSHALLGFALLGLGANLWEATMLEAIGLIGALFCFVLLALLWTPNISLLVANTFTNFLHGGDADSLVADFKQGRGLMKDEQRKTAVEEIERQLRKEPDNFEGRRLLISCHLDLDQPKQALVQAELLVQSPNLTEEQRTWTEAARTRLRDLLQ
jgi:hypothetical protein